MAQKLIGVKITTPKFRVNWPYVLKPRPNTEEGKKPQYSVTMLFEKGQDLTVIKKAIGAAAVEAWGSDKKKWPKIKSTPIKNQNTSMKTRDDGTEFMPDGYVDGAFMIEAKTYNIPGVVDQNCQKIVIPEDFYSGCFARATVTFKAYEYLGHGITCYLQNVQKWSDGPSLSGRVNAESDFTALDADDGTDATDVDDLTDITGTTTEVDNSLGL